ncbi:MAG TPA: hypothetical protein VNN79_24940 [Actinomycetota bacterium]|nr:hypothetical protein [Actinomycetota bacterium]
MGLQAAMRAASVTFLEDYATDASVKMQVYPARPRSINPPTGFVDLIREHIEYLGPTLRQRTPAADVIVVHGIFDSKEAADQKDAFVDGFLDWVNTRYHQAGANTLIAVTDTEDLPNYVPEWMPPERQLVYYATRLTLEGLALG